MPRWRMWCACSPSALQLDVGGEALAAALAAEPGLLVAAERARGVELVEGVGPHNAGAQPAGQPQDAAALFGPDARREAVRGVVGLGDRLVRGAEGQHREDRAEDLLLRHPVGLRDAGEHGGWEPEAARGQL